MKKVLLSGMLILSTALMAEELEEITIVDESQKSTLFQKGNIVGCENNKKKELSCTKEPKVAILSKLPSSQQLTEVNLGNKEKKEKIAQQLKDILEELNQLKKEQQANRETIEELKGLVTLLSDKKSLKSKKEATVVKKSIRKISKTEEKKQKSTLIKKKIKELSKTDTQAIVEVQNNESLSTYAQYYYGDNKKYYKIYKANKKIVGKNLQITIGQQLRIPLK